MGVWPNILRPRRLTEHLARKQAFGLFDQRHVCTADKYAVRDWVRARVGPDILVPLYQLAPRFEDLDWDNLPNSFVIKATHAQGGNYFVHDKAEVDRGHVEQFCRSQLARRFGWESYESFYLEIEPRLIVEKLLSAAEGQSPDDFKIYVFHGKPLFVIHMTNRARALRVKYYDTAWRPLRVRGLSYPLGPEVDAPTTLQSMLDVAAKLGTDFDFCRVDLYSVEETVYFGEITHVPGAGYTRFQPHDFDRYLGDVFRGKAVETIAEWLQ